MLSWMFGTIKNIFMTNREKHHLDRYKERFGKLPIMNANEGNLVKIEEGQNNDS